MANCNSVKEKIMTGAFDCVFGKLYPNTDVKERYIKAIDSFAKIYGDDENIRLFSAPGRTEVGGNHTDHQRGCVLAASVNLDVIAVAKKTDDNIIRIKSEGFKEDVIDLSVLSPQTDEVERASSLIRGVAARFKELGYNIGGFCAYTTSNVLKGSGLSSSAAFEVLVCTLLNSLYNDEKMNDVDKAIVSQYAENKFFNKPCGLMDQMACSVGGFVAIDFADLASPVIEGVKLDLAKYEHSLCIVDTGGCHADLTADYAGIPVEMKAVAEYFGKDVLRVTDEEAFYKAIPELRKKVGDRAVLRSIHFFDDNRRAQKLASLLKAEDFEGFLATIKESGRSSLQCLQNVFAVSNPAEQGLTLALTLTEKILGNRGAFRVHGGGFAGTIQSFVPNDLVAEYKEKIEEVFGEGSCYVLSVRPVGGIEIKD